MTPDDFFLAQTISLKTTGSFVVNHSSSSLVKKKKGGGEAARQWNLIRNVGLA